MEWRMEKHFGVTKCTGGVMTDQMIEKKNMKFIFSWTLKRGKRKEVHHPLPAEGSKKGSL